VSLSPVRRIGNTIIQSKHRASCHCGAVVLELDLAQGILDVRRCNCSMCRRKGAVMGAVALAGLHVLQGADLLSTYRFNTKTAEHYFCSRCGIYTHHRRRSNPSQYGFNIGCLEGVQPTDLENVPVSDGAHHVADRAR
jgi:hypothetical protein